MNTFITRGLIGLSLILSLSQVVVSQTVGTWQSYSSLQPVRFIERDASGTVWTATEGGLFSVVNGKPDAIYTRSENLYRLNPSAMVYHEGSGKLWLGYADGMLESFDPKTELFQTDGAIFRATQYSRRGVTAMRATGDRLYIATEFGIVVYDPVKKYVIDSYTNLGSFPSGTPVNDLDVASNTLYAATDLGLAYGSMTSSDLKNPTSWSNSSTRELFGTSVISKLGFNQNTLYATIGEINAQFVNGNWSVASTLGSGVVTRYRRSKSGTKLIAVSNNAVRVIDANGQIGSALVPSGSIARDVYIDDAATEVVYLGTSTSGLWQLANRNDSQPKSLTPQGPYLNFFSGCRMIGESLVCGTSQLPGRRTSDIRNTGFVVKKGNTWINKNEATDTTMARTRLNSLFLSAGTPKYYLFGSWGGGLALYDVATGLVSVFTPARGAAYSPSFTQSGYTVISGMDANTAADKFWFTIYLASPTPLALFDPQAKTFRSFSKPSFLSVNDHYFGLMVDGADQQWIPVVDASLNGVGLLVQQLGNLDSSTDDAAILLTQSLNNLPNNKIQALLKDLRGEVWIGTAEGLARYMFPDRVVRGATADRQAERLRIRNTLTGSVSFFLNRTSITALAVNAANEKWIGTRGDGVYHVREEGGLITILKHFTTVNSPLPSDNIESIAVDRQSGQVYIATDIGLLSYMDIVTAGASEMKSLKVYPNPFVYAKNSHAITIEGLSDETHIKVLAVDGRLVRTLDVKGGRTMWDAHDLNGNQLSTGIYTLIALSENGEQKGIGKVAIIK